MEIIENSGVIDVDHIETYLEYGISGDVLLSDEEYEILINFYNEYKSENK